MTDSLPHIEGKYQILRKLGEGGMGSIYLVRHRLLGELRVVKIMRPALQDDAEMSARFRREARTAVQLRHAHVAQVHDLTFDPEGRAYIVMEYVDGVTLFELQKALGPLPVSLVLEVAAQALTALDFLHRKSFIHRDISPDNLMLTRDFGGRPVLKLIDLGIAKALAGDGPSLTATGMFIGKARYSAPEQLSGTGEAEIDGRADLYSLAVVLYELLTGVCPIEGSDIRSWLAGHLFQPPKRFQDTDPDERVPGPLRALLLQCLAKAPEERPAGADALLAAVRSLQDLHPLRDESVARLAPMLKGPPASQVGEPPSRPTSVQGHLDRQFPTGQTPVSEVVPPPLPGPVAPEAAGSEAAVPEPAGPASERPTRRLETGPGGGPPPPPPPIAPQAAPPQAAPASPAPAAPTPSTSVPPPPAPAPARAAQAPPAPAPGAPVPPGPVPSSPAPAGPGERAPRRLSLWALVAAGAVVLAAVVLLTIARSGGLSDFGSGADAEPGTLVLSVMPWGRVVSVEDASGNALPLPDDASTPLALRLPPGNYTIEVENPDYRSNLLLRTEVEAGETRRRIEAFAGDPAEAFLREMGWSP